MSDIVYTRSRYRDTGYSTQTIPVAIPDYNSGTVQLTYSDDTTSSGSGTEFPTSRSNLIVVSASPSGSIFDLMIGASATVSKTFAPYTSGNLTAPARAEALGQLVDNINDSLSAIVAIGDTVEIYRTRDASEIHDVPTVKYFDRIAGGEVINNPVLNDKIITELSHRVAKMPTSDIEPFVQIASGIWGPNKLLGTGRAVSGSFNYPPFSEQEILGWLDYHHTSSDQSFFDSKQVSIDQAFGEINSGAYNYLEELGEAPETMKYIVTVMQRIADMFKLVKRGEFKTVLPRIHKRVVSKAKRQARQNGTHWKKEYAEIATSFISSAYMELRFAIRPMLYSIEDAVELHKEGLKAHAGRTTVNSRVSSYGSDHTNQSYTDGDLRVEVIHHLETERDATAGVLLEIHAAVANARMLGLTNIAGTAWELTFLSWAADYFLSTDGLLYHLTPDIGVTNLAAWSGTKDKHVIETTVNRYRASTDELLDTLTILSTRDIYQRHPVHEPGYIQLNVNLDVYKIADLASLFLGLRNSYK